MGLKEKLSGKFCNYFQDAYMQKYGDRITSVSGTILSAKIVEKDYFIIKRIMVELNRKIQSDSNKLKKEYHKLT